MWESLQFGPDFHSMPRKTWPTISPQRGRERRSWDLGKENRSCIERSRGPILEALNYNTPVLRPPVPGPDRIADRTQSWRRMVTRDGRPDGKDLAWQEGQRQMPRRWRHPPTPPSQGGEESWGGWSFPPLAKGGLGGVHSNASGAGSSSARLKTALAAAFRHFLSSLAITAFGFAFTSSWQPLQQR